MQPDNFIPLPIVKLLIAHFSHSITEEEKLQLDDWICASNSNMKVFEECLEITLLPSVSNPERGQNDVEPPGQINLN